MQFTNIINQKLIRCKNKVDINYMPSQINKYTRYC